MAITQAVTLEQVHGQWSNWIPWLPCRAPCGGSEQWRWRYCNNPAKKFLGTQCVRQDSVTREFDEAESQPCNTNSCSAATFTLHLKITQEAWATATSSWKTEIQNYLYNNLTSIYSSPHPVSAASFSFYELESNVSVEMNFSLTSTLEGEVLKIQDELYYHNRIGNMKVTLVSYTSSNVPAKPLITKMYRDEPKRIGVYFNQSVSSINPSLTLIGYQGLYRSETSDPDGSWTAFHCDWAELSGETRCSNDSGVGFHNYTIRIVPYNSAGFGLASDPYRMTTKEDKPVEAPTNLVGSHEGSTSIRIRWTPVPLDKMRGNSKGHRIKYREKDKNWIDVNIADHWINERLFTGLHEYIEYQFKVQARNTLHDGPLSAQTNILTDQDIPSAAPGITTFTDLSSTSLRVNWKQLNKYDKNGIISYHIVYLSLGTTMNSAEYTVNSNVSGGTYTHTFTRLKKYTQYSVQVATGTVKGLGPRSSKRTTRTSIDEPDAAPTSLTGSTASETSVSLQWNDVPSEFQNGPITQYCIKYYSVNNPGNVMDKCTGSASKTDVVTGLGYWTDYKLKVSAETSAGKGPYTNYITVKTDEHVPTAPPANFLGVNSSSYSIMLYWDSVPTASRHGVILGYTVTYRASFEASGKELVLNNAVTSSVELSGLHNFTFYTISIRAKNSKGNGAASGQIIVQTGEDVPSGTPASFISYNTSSTSLWVEWQQIPVESRRGTIHGYVLRYIDLTYGFRKNMTLNGAATLSHNLTGLDKFRNYSLEIRGFTKKGLGPTIATIAVTDQDEPEAPPTELTGSTASDTSVSLQWKDVPYDFQNGQITQYYIKYFSIDNPSNVLYQWAPVSKQDVVNGLHYWTNYNCSVAAKTLKGTGPFTNYITVKTDEHIPTAPPDNFRGINSSSYSIMLHWDAVPTASRHGIILGYTVSYRTTFEVDDKVLVINDSITRPVELSGLHNYTFYTISLRAYNSKGNGTSGQITVQTDEDVPSGTPSSILSYNTSSTSLWVEWQPIPVDSHRGIILGYMLRYTDLVYGIMKNLTLYGAATLSHNLTGLDEFRNYSLEAIGFTKKGLGPGIVTVAVTDQDIPASPPAAVRGHFITSSAIRISWDDVPHGGQNGKLTAVKVYIKIDARTKPTRAVNGLLYYQQLQQKKNNSSQSRKRRDVIESRNNYFIKNNDLDTSDKSYYHHRSRRSTVDLSGYNTVVLDPSNNDVVLDNLSSFMNYSVALQASTAKGDGPVSTPILVETGESVPTLPPQSVSGTSTSSQSILVSWLPVPTHAPEGIVYAYIVSYRRKGSNDPWTNQTAYEPNLSLQIGGLLKYVNYSIRVSAVTSKGSGPFSLDITVLTDQAAPSGKPANLTGFALSASELRFEWKSVPPNGVPSCCIHGILTGYKIWYKRRYVPDDPVRTSDLPPNQEYVELNGLFSRTPYELKVAATNIKGHGPQTTIIVMTAQDNPALPPQNISVTNSSSTSAILHFNELPFNERKGIILGYKIYYKVTRSTLPMTVKDVPIGILNGTYDVVYTPRNDSNEPDDISRRLRYNLTGLMKFIGYTFHMTAYTIKGEGPMSMGDMTMTDEDVPRMPPQNVSGYNTSSMSILVAFKPVPLVYQQGIEIPVCCQDGIITGYTIYYGRVDKSLVFQKTLTLHQLMNPNISSSSDETQANATLANGTMTISTLNETLCNTTLNASANLKGTFCNSTAQDGNEKAYVAVLNGLDPFKNYSIQIAGVTRKGPGVKSIPIVVITDEDIPFQEPFKIKGDNTSSTSLYVEWYPIPWENQNGIILAYTIYYRETLEPFDPEKSLVIAAPKMRGDIPDLMKWTFYDLRVYGSTSKGRGLSSANITIRTDQDKPSKAPQNVQGIDYTGPFSVFVKWSPVPTGFVHGVLLGYRVLYRKISEADLEVQDNLMIKTLPPNQLQTYLEDLTTYSTYQIQVLAFTSKGDGPPSNPVLIKTCRCVKHLYTNWWNLKPYSFLDDPKWKPPTSLSLSNLSFVPSGIHPLFIRDMAIESCGNCNGPRGHGFSVVHFDIDINGTVCQKDSLSACVSHANFYTDITFPVRGRKNLEDFVGVGKYLELIDYPNAAMLVLKKSKVISRTEALLNAIFGIWPLVVINLLMAILAGLLLWSLDVTSGSSDFKPSIFDGLWNGLWWAYITMTTVGYGDKTPYSLAAKIFCVMWFLFGLVLYSILTSAVTSALYVKERVIIEKVSLYDNPIAVLENSFDENIAVLKMAKAVKMKTVPEMIDAVKEEKVKGALLDSFVLSGNLHLINHTHIYVQNVVKTSAGYNYGVGLMGRTAKLVRRFQQYHSAYRQKLYETIAEYVPVPKEDEVHTESVDDALFSSKSPMFLNSLKYSLIAFGAGFVIGIVVTIVNYVRRKKSKRRNIEFDNFRMNYKYVIRMDLLHDTAQQVIEEFHKDVIKLVKRMEKSHHEQLVHLGFVDRVIRRMHKSGLRSAKYQVGLQRLSSNKVAPEVLASDCSRTFSVASKSRKKTKLKKISNASTALSDNITERFLEVASTRRSTFNSFSVAMSSPAPSSRSTSQSSY